MANIVTLCEMCKPIYEESFKLKPVPGRTTTEKKKKCEHCKRPYPEDVLKQYIVTGKGGR